MFVNEFFFSFSLLAFAAALLTLGTIILLDAFRRLAVEAWSKPASQKDSGVVLVVDVARPVAKRISNKAHDFLQGPIVVAEKKVS